MKLKYFRPEYRSLGDFDSPVVDFKNYWERQLNKDIKRHLCAGYVLLTDNEKEVVGYFTLSQNSVERDTTDNEKGSYPRTPATLLGRLAVNKKFLNNGYGKQLILCILNLHKKKKKTIGSAVLVIQPLETALGFYERMGIFKQYGEYLCIKTKDAKKVLDRIQEATRNESQSNRILLVDDDIVEPIPNHNQIH